jgi:hypothetical protein
LQRRSGGRRCRDAARIGFDDEGAGGRGGVAVGIGGDVVDGVGRNGARVNDDDAAAAAALAPTIGDLPLLQGVPAPCGSLDCGGGAVGMFSGREKNSETASLVSIPLGRRSAPWL